MEQYETQIEIKADPGAGILGYISSAYQHVQNRPYDICVIMAGAQDMIRYNMFTDRYFFPYQSTEEFVDYITSTYQEGESAFHQAHPNGILIFGTLTGIDLHRYAWINDANYVNQKALNDGIPLINSYIMEMNVRNHVPTCWLARKVHRNRENGTAHYYDGYLSEGYHPKNGLLNAWAEQLVTLAWRCS